jgi:hypothetical protein
LLLLGSAPRAWRQPSDGHWDSIPGIGRRDRRSRGPVVGALFATRQHSVIAHLRPEREGVDQDMLQSAVMMLDVRPQADPNRGVTVASQRTHRDEQWRSALTEPGGSGSRE